MAYMKTLDLPADGILTVTIPAADAARLLHGNRVYATLLAKAKAQAEAGSARRALSGDYTTSVDDSGGYTASFALVPL